MSPYHLELLYKMADDQLIYGHRNSEWIGLGPLLEEDIAFASIAQDKVGQSRLLYQLLERAGESDPDTLAFMRHAGQFHCCHLVELPAPDYELALARHLLFDTAEELRFAALIDSSDADLAAYARKLTGEIRYHVMHARSLCRRLLEGTHEAHERMVGAFRTLVPIAAGIFEPSPYEEEIVKQGLFIGEKALASRWVASLQKFLEPLGVEIPLSEWYSQAHYGGRVGRHTEHLTPLLDEMSEVYRLDPTADW